MLVSSHYYAQDDGVCNEEDSFYALYSEKVLEIPKIKLYTIYTGVKPMGTHYISLNELMTNNDVETDIDLKVKVICKEDKNNILGQYIILCSILKEELKTAPTKDEAIKRTIKRCQQDGILEEYLENRKYEVNTMLAHSITTDDWIEYRYKKGIEIGESRVRIQGLLMAGVSNAKIIELTGATEEEVLEIKNNM